MEIKDLIKKLPHDLRGEILANELTTRFGLDAKEVALIPDGHFKRTFQKDIAGIEFEERSGKLIRVLIHLNRNGLYDALPEGLFHQPSTSRANPFKSAEEMVKETRSIRKEEAEARHFFSVFESAINQLRISLEKMEREVIPGLSGTEAEHFLFEQLWGQYPELSDEQKVKLFYLLPVANRISGNAKELTLCLGILLNENVRVEYTAPKLKKAEIETAALGAMHLAIDTVVGNQFEDGIMDIQVSIGPLGKNELPGYLPFGKKYEVLKIFYNYFIPAGCDIVTELLIQQEIKQISLTKEESIGRLGYSSYLGG